MVVFLPSPVVGDVLGAGSHGTVFLQEQTDRTKVAVKRALQGEEGTLRHERAMLLHLHSLHPISGIPRVCSWVSHKEEWELAIEYIEGQVVEDAFLDAEHSKRLLDVITELFTIFAQLHARQIVHHDLHERNLLLSSTGHLYVIDFGLAQFQPEPCLYRSEVVDLWTMTRTWIDIYLPSQELMAALYDAWYDCALGDPHQMVCAAELVAAWHGIRRTLAHVSL